MPRARDPNLPQHSIDQGHYGEFPLELLPDGAAVGDVIMWDGTQWIVQENAAGDGKVLVSATDLVRAFLGAKIVAGENITIGISGTGADEQIVISSTATGGGGGEQLVADGVSPPEALTNEAGDDWLTEG